MANGVPGMPNGFPSDAAFGAFDTSMGTITFPNVPPINLSSLSADTGLSIVPSADGTFAVILGTQTLASGLTMPQAQDVVAQNATGAAVLSANPVAANVLSGNPLQPSIVGTDDGSGMIAPIQAPPSALCNFSTSVNMNPLIALAAVAGIAWLAMGRKR